MLRRRKALTGLLTVLACTVAPAAASAHGPPKITAGPEGTVAATDARFEFSYDEPAPTQTFECSLDGADFTACEDAAFTTSDPTGFQTYKDLAEGAHVFKVRRVSEIPMDPLGDPTPAERKWTIDLPDPEPTVTPSPDPSATPTPAPTPAGPPPPALDASKPLPCDGIFQITDKEGDWHHTNTDVLAGFFRYANGTLTANVVVKDLHVAVEHEDSKTVFWRLQWVASDGKGRYVGGAGDRGGATTFEYGAVDGVTYTREGATDGKLFTGANGVVQVAVPGVAKGSTLAKPVAVTGEEKLAGGYNWGDRGPGENGAGDPKATSSGADYVVDDCQTAQASGPGAQGVPASGVQGVALDSSALTVRYGRRITVRGRIRPGNSGVPVELVDAAGKVLAKASTAAGGAFVFRLRPRDSLELRVRSAGISSATLPVTVTPLVRLRKVPVKTGLLLKGWIRPARTQRVDVQQRTGGQWITVGTPRLRKGRFTLVVRGVRHGKFRIKEITA